MRRYGIGTRLNPPFIHDGKAWGMAFKFSSEPSGNPEGVVICTGVIQSVADLGGGRVRIVVRRDYQMSDYDKAVPGEGTINIVTQHFMGGNVCNSPEWMRAISHANDMAMRGTLSAIRAMIGDGFRITRGGKKHMSEVLLADAYSHVNEEVNYNGDATILPPTYIQADINDVGCTRETDADGAEKYYETGTLYFDDTAAAPMNCGLWIDTGSGLELAERLVFDSPETSAPDGNYLPPDFGAGITGAKYWWNALDLTARLASSCAAIGTSALLTWFNLGVARAEELPAASFTVVEGSDGVTGFDDAGDKLAMSAYSAANTFDIHFTVFQPGFAGWRRSTAHDSAAVWLSCDADGFVAMRARETSAGTISDIATDEGPYVYPFQVRLVRGSGGAFTGYARNIGDEWDEIGSVTPAGVPELSTGLVGFGVETNRKSGYLLSNTASTLTRDYYPIGTGIVGAQHLQRFKSVPFGASRVYPPGGGGVIASVINDSTGEPMTESATPRRDHYDFDGDGNLILYSESNDDRIKITYEELEDAPPGPGMPPRTFAQPNFATFAEPITEDRLATTDTAENIANNSDVIEIALEQSSWVPVPGEAFEIVRGAGVWPTSATITPQLDYKNDDEHDFELLDVEHYHLFSKYMGLVLVAEEKRAAIEAENVCMLVDAPRYVVRQAVPSINELKHAVEALDDLWISGGVPSGGLTGMSGSLSYTQGYTSQSVRTDGTTQTFWPDGYAIGLLKSGVNAFWVPDIFNPGNYLVDSMPYWEGDTRKDLRLRSTPFSDADQTLSSPPTVIDGAYSPLAEDIIAGEYLTIVKPWDDDGSGKNHFGAGVTPTEPANFGAFNFIPTGFSLPDFLRRVPDGAEILEARVRARITNMKYRTLTFETMRKLSAPNALTSLAHRQKATYNGVVTAWDEAGTGDDHDNESAEPGTYPDHFTAGRVSFQLIAVRRNSQYMVDYAGNTTSLPAYDVIGGGAVLAGGGDEVTSDEWELFDCTEGIKQLLTMLDSGAAYDGFAFVPTVGNPSPGGLGDGLGGYLDTLKPEIVQELFVDNYPESFTIGYTTTSRYAEFDSLEFGELQVRIRLGDGPAEWMALPMVMPVMRATVE